MKENGSSVVDFVEAKRFREQTNAQVMTLVNHQDHLRVLSFLQQEAPKVVSGQNVEKLERVSGRIGNFWEQMDLSEEMAKVGIERFVLDEIMGIMYTTDLEVYYPGESKEDIARRREIQIESLVSLNNSFIEAGGIESEAFSSQLRSAQTRLKYGLWER